MGYALLSNPVCLLLFYCTWREGGRWRERGRAHTGQSTTPLHQGLLADPVHVLVRHSVPILHRIHLTKRFQALLHKVLVSGSDRCVAYIITERLVLPAKAPHLPRVVREDGRDGEAGRVGVEREEGLAMVAVEVRLFRFVPVLHCYVPQLIYWFVSSGLLSSPLLSPLPLSLYLSTYLPTTSCIFFCFSHLATSFWV